MDDRSYFTTKDLTGCIEVEHVAGKSITTRLFSKYPLKLIVPHKVAPSVDVVWIYALSYGGGLVSGDTINIQVKIGPCSTAVFTTQASTKVYKSNAGLGCEQFLQVVIEQKGTFVMLPDPVTCFAAARYKQFQAFYLAADANVVLVDWCTSGRRGRGEVWSFDSYRSTNHIFLDGKGPLLLDSMCLEDAGDTSTIFERMQPFQVVAMVILYGPQLQSLCHHLEESIQILNQKELSSRARNARNGTGSSSSGLLASCSNFGPNGDGLVVRTLAPATELVYDFLRHHLAGLSKLIGVSPFVGK